MKKNFWKKLNKGFSCLAPMAGITDSAFRQMCKKYGADVVYSEMASVNALNYSPEKTLEMLKFEDVERPYVIQLFGSKPEFFKNAVRIIEKELNPDGVDINLGCPVPKVAKQNAGAELFKDLKLSKEVIKATIDSTDLPVSIKIRRQVEDIDALRFLDNVRDLDIKAIMIHGRTLKQMHSGTVDADVIKKARDYFGGAIIANGGVNNKESFDMLLEKSGADGVGIGQGALGGPWVFEEVRGERLEVGEIFDFAFKHAKLAYKNKGDRGIVEMRKHLCWYVQGMPGARKLREDFVKVETLSDIERIIQEFKKVG